MEPRVFYTLEEVSQRVGSREHLRELVEFHGLRLYCRLWGDIGEHIGSDLSGDNLRATGGYQEAAWKVIGTVPAEDIPGGVCRYVLDGWFKLGSLPSMLLAFGRSVADPHIASFDPHGLELGLFYGYGRKVSPDDARVRRSELDALLESPTKEEHVPRPLDGRERTTLLAMIGGIASVAGIDLTQPYKAAVQVEAALQAEGVTISARTIGDHLKAVRNALDSRKA